MTQKTGPQTSAAEKTIKDIRRATRKHHSSEKKSASCWRACGANTALPRSARIRTGRNSKSPKILLTCHYGACQIIPPTAVGFRVSEDHGIPCSSSAEVAVKRSNSISAYESNLLGANSATATPKGTWSRNCRKRSSSSATAKCGRSGTTSGPIRGSSPSVICNSQVCRAVLSLWDEAERRDPISGCRANARSFWPNTVSNSDLPTVPSPPSFYSPKMQSANRCGTEFGAAVFRNSIFKEVSLRTVLAVEDEPLIRLILIDALEDAAFHVIES